MVDLVGRTSVLAAILAAGALGAGCRELPPGPSSATPVINLTLVGGEPVHRALITWAARADSTIPRAALPIDPDLVALAVLDDSGVAHALRADTVPGSFLVTMPAESGGHYRLSGQINGRSIEAETTVPNRFTLTVPAGDTIGPSDFVPCDPPSVVFTCVTIQYDFDGPPFVQYDVRAADGTARIRRSVQSQPGQMMFSNVNGGTYALTLLALNSDAVEWLHPRIPRGNISRAAGGFNAALIARRTIVLP